MTSFHTFMHHSQSTYDLGIKFDYAGILLLMWGSTFPLIHYSFPHQITLQAAYVIVTTGLAGASLLATFNPSIGGPKLGHIRAVLFGSFGFGSFLVPIIHGVWMSGIAEQSRKVGLSWIGLTVFLNAVGVLAYALKVGRHGAIMDEPRLIRDLVSGDSLSSAVRLFRRKSPGYACHGCLRRPDLYQGRAHSL